MTPSPSPRPLSAGWLTAGLVALAVLAGCDSNAGAPAVPERATAPSDSAYARLLADLGGVDGLADFRARASDPELAATLARYGIAFEVVGATAGDEQGRLRDITACPQTFPTSDRTKWFRLVGAGGVEDHYIDSRGRPLTAFKSLGPVTTAPRQTTCQTNVGNWASPASSYDGGHLIGSQLGGWGGRANLVPQQYNFNRGNWKRIEDAVAKCSRLGTAKVEYHVDVDYPSSTTLTPSQFHADVKIGGAWKSADFTNTSGGGTSGTSQATSMVSWLQGKGCY
ncbi:DNA/RNA non-specific endonuclease [Rubrivirga sp.]|uniref:DNA/RNA non-specific endonuclease n=1 Tax=Rubrivirga sp. TaxID=1885344 RepID=UPI003B52963B